MNGGHGTHVDTKCVVQGFRQRSQAVGGAGGDGNDRIATINGVVADDSGYVPAFPASVVDTIGAGDSHAGGTLAGLAAGWSLADAVLLGNAVAAWVVSHRGGDCAPARGELLLAHKDV